MKVDDQEDMCPLSFDQIDTVFTICLLAHKDVETMFYVVRMGEKPVFRSKAVSGIWFPHSNVCQGFCFHVFLTNRPYATVRLTMDRSKPKGRI